MAMAIPATGWQLSFLDVLECLGGATRLAPSSEQTLLHLGHRFPGIFLLWRGRLELNRALCASPVTRVQLEPEPGEVVGFPAPFHLDARSTAAVLSGSGAQVLFLPRSLFQFDKRLAQDVYSLPIHWLDIHTSTELPAAPHGQGER
jgi:hypothetical protein